MEAKCSAPEYQCRSRRFDAEQRVANDLLALCLVDDMDLSAHTRETTRAVSHSMCPVCRSVRSRQSTRAKHTTAPFAASFCAFTVFALRPASTQRPLERTVSCSLVAIHPIEVTKLMTENHTPLPDMPVRRRFFSRGVEVIALESATAQTAAQTRTIRHTTIATRAYRRHPSMLTAPTALKRPLQHQTARAKLSLKRSNHEHRPGQ